MQTFSSKSMLFFLLLISSIACTNTEEQATSTPSDIPSVAYGSIERIDSFPSRFVSARGVDVWLPEGYSASQRYPVLYMHDGRMLFDSTTTWNNQEWGADEVAGRMIEADSIVPAIIVGVWNSGPTRHADYFPQKPFELLPQQVQDSLLTKVSRGPDAPLFASALQADNYLKFLTSELKPYIDSVYATLPDQQHTYVAGSSMGGLISMYAICEYPEVYSRAACLSTHWPGTFSAENNPIPAAFASYMEANLPDPATHRIYFDYGTETLDALYEPFQMMVDSVMQKRAYDSTNWVTRKFPGADHSENAWRARLHIPFYFLLKKD